MQNENIESFISKIGGFAKSADRFALTKMLTPNARFGFIRMSDVVKIGPANPNKFKMPKTLWEERAQKAFDNEQCKGTFCAAFKGKNLFRQCDREAEREGFCAMCERISKNVDSESEFISLKGIPEYEPKTQALFARAGIQECRKYWHEQVQSVINLRAESDMDPIEDYPFFEDGDMITRFMLRGKVIFPQGGKGGRSYARSRFIVDAQDEYLRDCLWSALTIMQYENGSEFKHRWEAIVKPAIAIHNQMAEANESDDMPSCGAIQAADIIRHELHRAAEYAEQVSKPATFISNSTAMAYEWALRAQEVARNSPESVSSSAGKRSPYRRVLRRDPLAFVRVNSSQTDNFNVRETKPPPVYKMFKIQQSTIPGAGQGFFLLEKAKKGENVARFSGVSLSKEETKASKSQYRLQISKKPFVVLDAQATNEWEGKKLNDASRSGGKNNARFAAGTVVNKCKKTGKLYVNIVATEDIEASLQHPTEMFLKYGECFNWPTEVQAADNIRESGDGTSSAHSVAVETRGDSCNRAAEKHVTPDTTNSAEGSALSSQIQDDDSSSDYTTPDSQKRKSPNHSSFKVYAVAMGRCVGLFLSKNNAEASTFGFPGCLFKKFSEQEEARAYLRLHGIEHPTCYWKNPIPTASLLRNPETVVGAKVSFPVGISVRDAASKKGYVIATLVENDVRVWKVQILGGNIDTMKAWPLQCCIMQFKKNFNKGNAEFEPAIPEVLRQSRPRDPAAPMSESSPRQVSNAPVCTDVQSGTHVSHSRGETFAAESNTVPSNVATQKNPVQNHNSANNVIYGIRGTNNGSDGVVYTAKDLAVQLRGPQAEFSVFHDLSAAKAWVESKSQWCAVRLQTGHGMVMSQSQIHETFGIGHSLQIFGPTDSASAKTIANHWSSQAIRSTDNIVNGISGQQLAAENVRVSTSSFPTKPLEDGLDVGGRGAHAQYPHRSNLSDRVRGRGLSPARRCSFEKSSVRASNTQPRTYAENVDREMNNTHNRTCIATNDDGTRCEQTENLQHTQLGKLCRRHLQMFLQTSSNSSQRTPAEASCMKPTARQDETVTKQLEHSNSVQKRSQYHTPEKGITECFQGCQAMAKEKGGSSTVFALRTFPETVEVDEPAGSIWLSSNEAELANKNGGKIKIFAKDKDICVNIAQAVAWIQQQTEESVTASVADEFEQRMQEAREKVRQTANTSAKGKQKEKTTSTATKNKTKKSGNTESDRGGMRSSASILLDKAQAKVSNQLFPKDAQAVVIREGEVPSMSRMVQIPLPGEAQALTASGTKQVLSFDNDMQATLAPRKFSTFKAFSLAELLEFQQRVEYVANLQDEEQSEVAWSVVVATRLIVTMASRMYASMRDAGELGESGDVFKATMYTIVMHMVMFREIFTGTLAEMFFMSFAKTFAKKAKGRPGMGITACLPIGTTPPKISVDTICLYCGKSGHMSNSPIHQAQLAEGGGMHSTGQLSAALAEVTSNKKLSADKKKYWQSRITKFWDAIKSGGGTEASSF